MFFKETTKSLKILEISISKIINRVLSLQISISIITNRALSLQTSISKITNVTIAEHG